MQSTVINALRWHRARLLPVALVSFVLLIAAFITASAQPPLGEPNEVWVTSSAGDTMYVGQQIEFHVYFANSMEAEGISIAFGTYSPDSATWDWMNQPDGYGSAYDTVVTMVPGCRIDGVFDLAIGVTTEPMPLTGGPTLDKILVNGLSYYLPHMTAGPLEHMLSLHLVPTHAGIICIDSTCVHPCGLDQWSFFGMHLMIPAWAGPLCFTVIEPPDVPGDINCDGSANVGDAVYLVNWIFKNGPAPCR